MAEDVTDPVVGLLEEVWTSTGEATEGLDEGAWSQPSELPGWTVKDCLAHVAGTESALLGEPGPDVDVSHLAHVSTPFQELMEKPVERWRPRSGSEVRDWFLDVTRRRLGHLRAMTPEEMDAPSWSPIGEVPYREFMRVRVFDCWMHEQDIRRVVGRPGHLSGPALDPVLERFRGALGFVVGKKADVVDGTRLLLRTTGPTEVALGVVVDGRATVVDEAELGGPPDVEVTLPIGTLAALGGGRWDRARAEAEGGVAYGGDAQLGRRVLDHMAFTP
jgi:uncharacterized protein (TIGR03083 family)